MKKLNKEGKMKGFSVTQGQQGGIGYPPLIVKFKNKWVWVENSRNHGGTTCHMCSVARGIPCGGRMERFGVQKSWGSRCYRSLVKEVKPYKSVFTIKDSISWDIFVEAIKKEKGEPEILKEEK